MFKAEGLDDFLAKPIEMSKLNAILKRWLPQNKQQGSEEIAAIEEIYLEIAGVDTQRGIIRSGGTAEAYHEILATYVADSENRLVDMAKYHRENDIRALTICVHAIKSASANIGASDVSQLAAELEAAGKNGDTGYIDVNLRKFFDMLSVLLGNIQQYLGNIIKEEVVRDRPADKDALKTAITEIDSCMNNLDIDAAESVLEKLYTYQWDDAIFERIFKIKECIAIFDYDGIEVAMADLKAMIGAE